MADAIHDSDAPVTMLLAGELRVVVGKLIRKLREQAHAEDLTTSQK